jgi:ABC-2 type transport system permease protein
MNIFKLGIARGMLEIKQFNRQREAVVFTIFFPVMLLFIFGAVFKSNIAPGVSFSEYFVAGMIASGLVNSGFQNLAIVIPIEREYGTLKRLRGTPLSPVSYFLGKILVVFYSTIVQLILLMGFGIAFYGLHLPNSADRWLRFIWLIILGSLSSTVLGIAFSSVPKNGKSASAVVSPIVIVLQFFSGVFFVFTSLPKWMQDVAAVFPLKWLTQGMRSVFLPDSFQVREVAHSWESGKTIAVLLAWTLVGIALSLKSFKWSRQ